MIDQAALDRAVRETIPEVIRCARRVGEEMATALITGNVMDRLIGEYHRQRGSPT